MSDKDEITTQDLFDVITDLQSEVGELKQIINNGIVLRVEENTDCLNNLFDKVESLENKMKKKGYLHKGKLSTWKVIGAVLGSIGTGMGILYTLIQLGIIAGIT